VPAVVYWDAEVLRDYEGNRIGEAR
jgi:hypothetical protein